ncbi:gluconokinase [Phanerochaete sordida]|uniref:Gluconokinase n=1 Tax=Phanerochaete sordida TaxID=48140 RepID=A0A9P3GDF3_9APHY|nr:gluconokinase [Phanerochaete sordida]
MEPREGKLPVLIIVMGVASTGKTTLAKALNEKLGLPYVEGDDLHPKNNIEKMSNGIPLTDADREPWLELIRTTAEHMVAAQQARATPETASQRVGVMVTCSALKRYYRDILRGTRTPQSVPEHIEPPTPARLATYFVYIKADESILRERMANRQGHFMKPKMLDSQLATLESPEGEDGVVVVPLEKSTEEQVDIAIEELKKSLGDLDFRTVEDRKAGEPEEVDVSNDVVVGK